MSKKKTVLTICIVAGGLLLLFLISVGLTFGMTACDGTPDQARVPVVPEPVVYEEVTEELAAPFAVEAWDAVVEAATDGVAE